MAHRARTVVAFAAACMAGLAGSAHAALTQVPVKATTHTEQVPGTGAGAFAWSENTAGHPNAVHLFVEVGGGPAVRVNPQRTRAWAGVDRRHDLDLPAGTGRDDQVGYPPVG